MAEILSRHIETLYGPEGYYVTCRVCGAELEAGEEAVIGEDQSGAYVYAECLAHSIF